MGLPMWNSSPKADEGASNKPPVNSPTATRNPALSHSGNPYGTLLGSSSSSSSTLSTDDRTLRWERLHSLRNRLVDRMYRLEMDEMLNNTHRNNNPDDNENGEGPSGVTRDTQVTLSTSATTSTIPVVTPSRPVPIPTGRPIQVSSVGSVSLDGPDAVRNWASLHRRGENSEAQGNSTRTEGGRQNESQPRREARGESRRRAEETRRILEAREARRRANLDLLQSGQFQSHVPVQAQAVERQAVERQAVGRQASDRQVADNRGDALITLDEFLRESREPVSDNDEVGPAPFGIQRSSSIPPINRLRAGDSSRLNRWVNPVRPEMLGDGRLGMIRPDDAISPAGFTVPQTLSAATWWPLPTPPPGHHIAPNETFDTFIGHIRRIGHLQDAMLATIRSSNSTLALAAGTPGTNPAGAPGDASSTASGPATIGLDVSNSTTQSTATAAARPVPPTTTSDNPVTNSTTPPSLNVAEARLRAMQTRIDILTSEFSLLRSSWALSHVENQGYERSLRRLQEYLPSARRAERARRGNRGGEVSLHYEDLHADAAAREADLIPRNPWGESDAERNRERMRMAAAWALGREGLATNEIMGSTGVVTAEGNREVDTGNAVPMVLGENTAKPFSVEERELQKKLLAAKMEELTLRGMR
ncbi:hypothetical protein L211DRAFT_602244 [Terfezia boudieri ATCC MYA-4762]|uniref:Uncharacterized protein n=1 Tax=Terfezia boudieri ATCC MYA-4762 TaxID=1051890 RepID=A0A3N4M242_9PEZI|nr:hypothetical protein L211DRAFT_602244 [Terfezia boudieri ATCC MYA-4762]